MLTCSRIQLSAFCLAVCLLVFAKPVSAANTAAGPIAVCEAFVNVALGDDCTVVLTPEMIDGGSFDPDGDPLTFSLDLTSPVGPGEYVVFLSVSDGTTTNQCFSTVTVAGNGGSTAVCFATVNFSLGIDGTGTLLPEMIDAGSTANCGVSLSFASGPSIGYTCADVGTVQTVTLVVTDHEGSENTCWSEVTIEDKLTPTAVCVSTVNVNLGNDAAATLDPTSLDAGSSDNCPLTFTLASGPVIYTCADVGSTNTVTLVATDPGGNFATCTAQVSVSDSNNVCADADGDGFIAAVDCNDANVDVYPGAPELCDGLDNDCDDQVDEPDNVNAANIWIEAISLASLNNVSGNNGGYADFTALSTSLNPGGTYTVTLTPGVAGYDKKLKWRVYLDLNQDGLFSNAEEKVVQAQSKNPVTASFTLPAGTSTGTTALRVIVGEKYQQGCDDDFNGEVEDYTVEVATAVPLNARPAAPEAAPAARDQVASRPDEQVAIRLYPNPADQFVNIRTEAPADSAELALIDGLGRLVHTQIWPAGHRRVVLKMDDLKLIPGVYFVVITTEVDRRVERLMVRDRSSIPR